MASSDDHILPWPWRVLATILCVAATLAASYLFLRPLDAPVFPPQCATKDCLTYVPTVQVGLVLGLLTFAALCFFLAANGRRLSALKVAGFEVPFAAPPALPTRADVAAIERAAEERDADADAADDDEPEEDEVPRGAVLRTTPEGVNSYRLDDVPAHVLADALSHVETQASDRTRTFGDVESVFRKPGRGQPWYVKLRDGGLWRVTYAGRRKRGQRGKPIVRKVA